MSRTQSDTYQVWSYPKGCIDIAEHQLLVSKLSKTHAINLAEENTFKMTIDYIEDKLYVVPEDRDVVPTTFYIRKHGDPTYLLLIESKDGKTIGDIIFEESIAQRRVDALNQIYQKNGIKKTASLQTRDDCDIRGEHPRLNAQNLPAPNGMRNIIGILMLARMMNTMNEIPNSNSDDEPANCNQQ